MEKALLPLLHDIDYDMYGPQNLVGIIEPSITYTVTWGQALVRPPRPTTYDLTIQENSTPAVRNHMEAAHTLLLQDYCSYVAAKNGAAIFIPDSVNETYYKDREHATTFYNRSRPRNLSFTSKPTVGVLSPKISLLYKQQCPHTTPSVRASPSIL